MTTDEKERRQEARRTLMLQMAADIANGIASRQSVGLLLLDGTETPAERSKVMSRRKQIALAATHITALIAEALDNDEDDSEPPRLPVSAETVRVRP